MTSNTPVEQEILSGGECWERRRAASLVRIVYLDERTGVEVFPVNYVVDSGTIVLRTAAGTKLSALIGRPPVAFESDGGDLADGTAWAVVLHGTAEPMVAHDEIVDAFDLDLSTWHGAPKPFFVRVVPTDIVGRGVGIGKRP